MLVLAALEQLLSSEESASWDNMQMGPSAQCWLLVHAARVWCPKCGDLVNVPMMVMHAAALLGQVTTPLEKVTLYQEVRDTVEDLVSRHIDEEAVAHELPGKAELRVILTTCDSYVTTWHDYVGRGPPPQIQLKLRCDVITFSVS